MVRQPAQFAQQVNPLAAPILSTPNLSDYTTLLAWRYSLNTLESATIPPPRDAVILATDTIQVKINAATLLAFRVLMYLALAQLMLIAREVNHCLDKETLMAKIPPCFAALSSGPTHMKLVTALSQSWVHKLHTQDVTSTSIIPTRNFQTPCIPLELDHIKLSDA